MLNIQLGKYDKALYYGKIELELLTTFGDKIATYCNLALTNIYLNEFKIALKYYDVIFNNLQNQRRGDLYTIALCDEVLLYMLIGDFSKSIKLSLELINSNNIILLLEITKCLFFNYYYINDQSNCIKYLEQNKNNIKLLNHGFKNKINESTKYFQIMEALYLLKFKPNIYKKEILHNLIISNIGEIKSFNAKIELKSYSLVYLSLYYLIDNKNDISFKYLKEFLNEFKFKAFNLLDVRILIDFALSRPELSQYKDKVHNAFTEFFDRPNIEGTSDEYKQMMKLQIENIYDINMTSFGMFELKHRGVSVPDSKWRRKTARSVLSYIMTSPKAKYSKDKITELFLSDIKPETANDMFRQVIFEIRKVFKNEYLNFIFYKDNTVYLNPDCYFKSDADEFNKLCIKARTKENDSDERIKACKDAIGLYKGEFMEGNYEPWCEDLRDEFRNKFVSISEILITLLSKEKDYEGVFSYSETLLKHDKLNEHAYLNLVEAHVISGKKKAAKDIYTKMLNSYMEELSESPNPLVLNKINNLLQK
jgi:DNA-binding SARP family transcriptional activator